MTAPPWRVLVVIIIMIVVVVIVVIPMATLVGVWTSVADSGCDGGGVSCCVCGDRRISSMLWYMRDT